MTVDKRGDNLNSSNKKHTITVVEINRKQKITTTMKTKELIMKSFKPKETIMITIRITQEIMEIIRETIVNIIATIKINADNPDN